MLSKVKVSWFLKLLSTTNQDKDTISHKKSSAALFLRYRKLETSLLRWPW